MVDSRFTKTGSLSSDRCKIWPSARETCSNVICGFFFPKMCCLRRQDVHRDSRTKPMANQALIGSHFKGAKTTLLFGPLEPLFHMPASEAYTEHCFKRRVFRSVANEVLDFFGLRISGHNEPIQSIGRTRSAIGILRHQVDPSRLHVPHTLTTGRLLDAKATPLLLGERRAKTANIVNLF